MSIPRGCRQSAKARLLLVNEEKPGPAGHGYPQLLATDIDPRRMRPPYRQLRPGSRLSLGLLGPAMPLGSRFARYFDACLVGALFCTCLDARVVFDWQSAKPEVRPKLARTTLP